MLLFHEIHFHSTLELCRMHKPGTRHIHERVLHIFLRESGLPGDMARMGHIVSQKVQDSLGTRIYTKKSA